MARTVSAVWRLQGAWVQRRRQCGHQYSTCTVQYSAPPVQYSTVQHQPQHPAAGRHHGHCRRLPPGAPSVASEGQVRGALASRVVGNNCDTNVKQCYTRECAFYVYFITAITLNLIIN